MRVMTFIGATAMLALLSAPAHAEWYVTPYVGTQFGGAANQSFLPGIDAETDPLNIGVNGGWMRSWFGLDADLGYHPGFFDNSGGFMSDSSLLTLMGNARVSVPMNGSVRPFATGGVGMIRPNLSEPGGLAKFDDMKFGWNVGGGLTGYVSDHVGVQGDVRYFRSKDDTGVANPFGVDFDGFHFMRASVGVSFKW